MSIPSRWLSITQDANVFAVATGSTSEVVGVSVSPKAVAISAIPAAAYCDLIDDF